MAYAVTESGYNMYDILSCMQKAIRRGMYDLAAFSASELKTTFRKVMWNRLFVISSEDCYGILTKELLNLYEQDMTCKNTKHIGNAVALLCRALKSRDACYFSCNFILDSRNPRSIDVKDEEIPEFVTDIVADDEYAFESLQGETQYDIFGFANNSKYGDNGVELSGISEYDEGKARTGIRLQKAIFHRDMDEIGYHMDLLRGKERIFLWDVLIDYAIKNAPEALPEVKALSKVDGIVNGSKKVKDEIFLSKAVMILCYARDCRFETIKGIEIIDYYEVIDWSKYNIKPIGKCRYSGELPEFVYDCHTLKGKRMGKTDWDMTRTEQDALYRLQKAYFDDASWIYTYEQDYRNGVLDDAGMKPIREFAKTHPVNPVQYIPY